jgi:hypothetical protein
MTNEQLFELVKDDPLFKSINQAKSIEDFLLVRTAEFIPVETEKHMRDWKKQKLNFERKFREGKFENLDKYLDVLEKMDGATQFLYFQQGFFEGFKFIVVMGGFSIVPASYLEYLDTIKTKPKND